MEESTPLLVDIDDNINTSNGEYEAQTVTPASAHFRRLIKILIITTIIFSALTAVLVIADCIILICAPFSNFRTWNAQNATSGLGIIMVVSIVFSVINLLAEFPILLNVIVDIVLTASITPRVVHLLQAFPTYDWCQIEYRYPPYPGNPKPEPILPHPKCEDWKLVVKILMGTAAGFGMIVTTIYLVLLVLRSVAILRTKSWERWIQQVSFDINIKFFRPEDRATTGNVHSVAEAGPGSAHDH